MSPLVADLPPNPSSAVDSRRRLSVPAIVCLVRDTLSGLGNIHEFAITHAIQSSTLERVSESLESAAIEQIVKAAIDEIERYGRFHRGWDGYDAEPFAQQTIDVAKAYATACARFVVTAGARSFDIIPGPA